MRALFIGIAVALASGVDANGNGALRVFLDCESGCDQNFLKREITFVDYVRDQTDSEVHVLIVRRRSASGREYTLNFHGREALSVLDYEITFNSSDIDTNDDRRRRVAKHLELGLVPFLLKTGRAEDVALLHTPPREIPAVRPTAETDPWNYWVFRSEVRGNIDREDRRNQNDVRASFSASRTTENWRFTSAYWYDNRIDEFEFEDGTRFKSRSKQTTLGASLIKSIGEHWGAGFGVRTDESTFRNLDQSTRLGAALEYNLFPYAESSERELTFGYYVGVNRFEYIEATVFGLKDETRVNQGIYAEYDLEQRWGDLSFDLRAAHFLDDPDLYRVRFRGEVDYRLTRGLELSVSADAVLVRDQIYLPAGLASEEEILLGQRALDTGFETRFGIGLKYTFGSIFNNVVNDRVDSQFMRVF